MNIMNSLHNKGKPSLLYFIDAERAFDRIEWAFLKGILAQMNFDSNFCFYSDLTYSDQKAAIVLYGYCSIPIVIQRGVRQGCPLSPLLFNLVMETWATTTRASPAIQEMEVARSDH